MQSALRKLKIRLIRVRRNENGAALLEFAIIAVPFLGLIFGMLEVGLIFWAGYELDNATLTASRLIKTGQAQKNNYTQDNMVTQICSHVAILSDCTSKLQLKVQSFSNFDCAAHPTQGAARRPPITTSAAGRRSNWSQAPTNGPSSISRPWRS